MVREVPVLGSTDIRGDDAGTVALPDQLRRPVVLEPLGEDCLRDGELHENIRLRLLRIRELPSRSVATLVGVWRREGRAWLAWESIPAPTLKELLEDASVRPDRLLHAAESLRRSVLSLHRLGLVHGDLREENVVVRDDAAVLTRLSPLLHHDPQRDLDALASIECRVRARLAGIVGAGDTTPRRPGDLPLEDRRRDARGWIAVAAVIAMGATISLAAWWFTRTGA